MTTAATAVLTAALTAATAAAAQTPAEPSGGAPLPPLTVRPSGFEDPDADARARQERLLSRMQQNEYRFRSICIQCGTGPGQPPPSAPFRPVDTLAAPARPSPAPAPAIAAEDAAAPPPELRQ
jgi:hypothetical protein